MDVVVIHVTVLAVGRLFEPPTQRFKKSIAWGLPDTDMWRSATPACHTSTDMDGITVYEQDDKLADNNHVFYKFQN